MMSIRQIIKDVFSKGLVNSLDEIQSSPEFLAQEPLVPVFIDPPAPVETINVRCRSGFESLYSDLTAPNPNGGMN